MEAEADKESKILKAQAEREARILRSEGEAEAIIKVQTAKAKGINEISSAKVTPDYITIKKLETLANVGNGRATKIIVPSDIQKMTGLAVSVKEAMNTEIVDDVDEETTEDESLSINE